MKGDRIQTEEEPELLPDVRRDAERPPAWWSSAWSAAERKIDGYGDQMSRMFAAQSERMTNIERRLIEEAKQSRAALNGRDQRLDGDTSARPDQMANMDSTLRNITGSLSKLETGATEVKKDENIGEQVQGRHGWSPAHVILGGWAENAKKHTIEAEAAKFDASLPL